MNNKRSKDFLLSWILFWSTRIKKKIIINRLKSIMMRVSKICAFIIICFRKMRKDKVTISEKWMQVLYTERKLYKSRKYLMHFWELSCRISLVKIFWFRKKRKSPIHFQTRWSIKKYSTIWLQISAWQIFIWEWKKSRKTHLRILLFQSSFWIIQKTLKASSK